MTGAFATEALLNRSIDCATLHVVAGLGPVSLAAEVHPVYKTPDLHWTDIAVSVGTPVKATAWGSDIVSTSGGMD